MRELGISVEETAVMSSLTPLFLIMIPPLAGLFADKIGNFRVSFLNYTYYNRLFVLKKTDSVGCT